MSSGLQDSEWLEQTLDSLKNELLNGNKDGVKYRIVTS